MLSDKPLPSKRGILSLGFLGFGKIAQHHAKVFGHLGCSIDCIQSRQIPGNVFKSDVDAIVVALLPEVLPEYIDQIMADPRPCLIEKCPPVDGPENKIVAYNRRFYETVGILRNRASRGGLAHLDGDLPPSGAQMHGFDLMMHLFGAIRANTTKGSLNTSIRAIFTDGSVWTLKPFETLTVVDGGAVEGTESDNLRKYTYVEKNRWSEDSTIFKPGFLEQARNFIRGVKTGDFGFACTLKENKRRYEMLAEMGDYPAQYSRFIVRKV